jgi:hypothetical protein
LEGSWFEASLGKKLVRPHLNQKELGVVAHACHPCYEGSVNRRVTIQAGPGINAKPYFKNNQRKRVRDMLQGPQHLFSKALSPNPSNSKKKEKRNESVC